MISVLYIHHAGTFGGASRSLLEMIKAFPEDSVKAQVIVQKGNVAGIMEKMGLPHIQVAGLSQFDNTRYGHYRGLRWLLLLRELYYAPFTIHSIWQAKRKWKDIDIIHVNEVTQLLSIVAASLLFGKPVVVHMRSVQNGGNQVTALVRYVIRKFAARVVAIDETVKASSGGLVTDVVHNGFSAQGTVGDEGGSNPLASLSPDTLKVAMIGNVLSFKGTYEFLDAARICRERGLAVDFVIVGGSVRKVTGFVGFLLKRFNFAKDVMGDILRYVHEHGLENRVHFFPVTPNIRPYYEHIHVLCFPSHLDAVGRPVFEAAFFKVPGIVAIRNPLEDTFIDGETGIRIDEKDSQSLATAIEYFHSRPEEIVRMGEAAYRLAQENFNIHRNAAKIVGIYKEVLGAK